MTKLHLRYYTQKTDLESLLWTVSLEAGFQVQGLGINYLVAWYTCLNVTIIWEEWLFMPCMAALRKQLQKGVFRTPIQNDVWKDLESLYFMTLHSPTTFGFHFNHLNLKFHWSPWEFFSQKHKPQEATVWSFLSDF